MTNSHSTLIEGNIRRELIGLTLPLIAGEILQQLYNTVDSLIIGRFLGTDAFAASGIAGSVMNLLIFVLSGFCVGVSVLFSGEYGAGSITQFRKSHFTAAVFGSAFSVLLSVIFILLTDPILHLVATPESLMGYCRDYLIVILGGMIATYFNNLFAGVLRSVGATRISLLFLTVSIVSNVILDLLLIAVWPLGMRGAAIATVLAQIISAAGSLMYILRRFPELVFRKTDAGYYPAILRQIFGFGLSSAMHMSSLYIGKFVVQGIVNTCGTAAIAAYTAATRIEGFINSPGSGFAQASSILIASNRGAGKPERVKQATRESFVLILSAGIVLAVIMYLAAPFALRLFLQETAADAFAAGMSYLKIIFFFYALSYLGYFFIGASRGHAKMMLPFQGTTIQIAVRVLLSWLLIGRMGLAAVAWATGIGWFFVVGYHYLCYRKYSKETILR